MKSVKTRLLLELLLVTVMSSARGDIQPGSRFEQVVQEIGYGESSMKMGKVEVRNYKDGTRIRFENGVVTEITRRGQIGATRAIRHSSPTALNLNQELARNDLDLQDRSDHGQTVQQGGKTSVLTVQDEDRGAVLKFDGQDAYLRVAHPDLDLAGGLTLCAWVKPDSLNQQSPVLEWEKNGAHFWVNAKGLEWQGQPTGVNWCIQSEGAGNVVSTTNPPAGQWTHLAVTLHPRSRRSMVFFNGERVAEKSIPGTPRVEGDLIVGARPSISGDARFKGLMDEILVVQRSMDEEEIKQIMGPVSRRVAENVAGPAAVPKPAPATQAQATGAARLTPPKKGEPTAAVRSESRPATDRPSPANALPTPGNPGTVLAHVEQIAMGFTLLVFAMVLLAYVFSCYCYKRICQKAGQSPGALIWIPLVQFIPLLRVAQMADWMLLLLLIPLVNVVAMVILWAKICAALNRSPWLAATLLVPLVNLILVPYLAFSGTACTKASSQETL